MKLIVGLGNPGAKYKNNRHNIGFMVIDEFAKNRGLSWRYNPDWICYFAKTADFILIKPATYMNRSGQSSAACANFLKIEPKDILAIHDDLDLEFNKIRISFAASAAGHHGIESLIESLGTFEFSRLRVGIAKPQDQDVDKYVLEDFESQEKELLPKLIKKCEEAIDAYLQSGIEATMNQFN